MARITIEVVVQVECAVCGASLEGEYNNSTEVMRVTPCESCLKETRSQGYDAGYEEGCND